MAHIDYPSSLSPSLWTMSLISKHDAIHQSIYTDEQQVISRGVMSWSGEISFGPYSVRSEADKIEELKAFVRKISNPANTFDLPIPNLDQDDRFEGAIQADAVTNDGSLSSLELDTTSTELIGFKKGDYLKVGDRMYCVLEDQLGELVSITPSLFVSDFPQDVVWENPTFRARINYTSISNLSFTQDGDFIEQILIPWMEVK